MVSIIMGSKSDLETVKKSVDILKYFGVKYEVKILSAHRTPEQTKEYVKGAEKRGTKIFIGAAGKAAHLAGVIASYTTMPVIGIPIKTSDLGGMDSLLSMVQMPSGIPVATVAINGSENAGILAVQMLSINDENLSKKLLEHREKQVQKILSDDEELQKNI
ncbi:5-(carboxyamino)imidazole ribonucleotide mutase [Peptoanaerobacter stomatis]